ncbi:metalloregulator ArsR/SmtB family transcription factor [Microlunatus panaciterrae]|uniref:DNA-binding transcriptional ArsR family regulator n=1 Tax=Microlunatus panaciterrae TaxID=400768 RepID=A0ABS2RJS2_9ACTN|nr:metalloregulator ArsR/SmtB family transcription factor [Microlunatus panaciterrae]MBM7799259.1 DNA-binding transcriptional ArsR family regulator [Microlunatus panaciterrae]
MPDPLSAIFAALADPTRRAILAQLARGESTVNELAAPHPISLPAVSRHLKVLQNAGLVVKGRDAQWRPCRLDPTPLHDVDAWLASYREFFDGRLDRLEEHLKTLGGGRRTPAGAAQPNQPGSTQQHDRKNRPTKERST